MKNTILLSLIVFLLSSCSSYDDLVGAGGAVVVKQDQKNTDDPAGKNDPDDKQNPDSQPRPDPAGLYCVPNMFIAYIYNRITQENVLVDRANISDPHHFNHIFEINGEEYRKKLNAGWGVLVVKFAFFRDQKLVASADFWLKDLPPAFKLKLAADANEKNCYQDHCSKLEFDGKKPKADLSDNPNGKGVQKVYISME